MDKKNLLTYQGLQKLENELQELKVVKRKEIAQKRTLSTMQQKMSSVISRHVLKRSRKF